MNGFMLRLFSVAATAAALAGAAALPAAAEPAAAVAVLPAPPAHADRLSATMRVSITILPGAQTHFDAREPAGSRFAVTDDGGRAVDMTDVHVYVRDGGTERRYVDVRAAETAIVAAQRQAAEPVVVTLVF